MNAHLSHRAVAVALVATLGGWDAARGQDGSDRSKGGGLAPPPALLMDQRQLQGELAPALTEIGAVGETARAIERLLTAHFKRETDLVLPPLGLVPGLADGGTPADASRALALIEQVDRELPQLLQEHRTLIEATRRLKDAAKREGKPAYLALADRLWLHALVADQVLYPMTTLVGRHLRLQRDAKPKPIRESRR